VDELGPVLALLRRRRRWSIATLARRSGVAAGTVARLEGGGAPFDAECGRRLIRTLVARDPTLYAMAMLCCATFHAELGEREALCWLARSDVAGCA
jgi:Helix-turn-helix domain